MEGKRATSCTIPLKTTLIHLTDTTLICINQLNVLKKIHTLSDLNDTRQLSGRLSTIRFLGLKSAGKDCEGYPLQSKTLKLFGSF
jgi:hypothetical protein